MIVPNAFIVDVTHAKTHRVPLRLMNLSASGKPSWLFSGIGSLTMLALMRNSSISSRSSMINCSCTGQEASLLQQEWLTPQQWGHPLLQEPSRSCRQRRSRFCLPPTGPMNWSSGKGIAASLGPTGVDHVKPLVETVVAMYTSIGQTPGMKDANMTLVNANISLVNCKMKIHGIQSMWEKHAVSNTGVRRHQLMVWYFVHIKHIWNRRNCHLRKTQSG